MQPAARTTGYQVLEQQGLYMACIASALHYWAAAHGLPTRLELGKGPVARLPAGWGVVPLIYVKNSTSVRGCRGKLHRALCLWQRSAAQLGSRPSLLAALTIALSWRAHGTVYWREPPAKAGSRWRGFQVPNEGQPLQLPLASWSAGLLQGLQRGALCCWGGLSQAPPPCREPWTGEVAIRYNPPGRHRASSRG